MNTNWKKNVAAVLLAVSLTATPSAVTVFAESASAVQGQAALMKLTDHVRAELKGVFNEQTPDGATVGAVIRLTNDSGKVTRVPDYELRIFSSDGISYTLSPSAANARSIQPKGKAELAYMLNVDRTDVLELTKLAWVHVDDYVYPRKENTLLTMNIAGKVWNGYNSAENRSTGIIKWGQPFKLDFFSPSISYTPTSMQKQTTAQGNVTVVTVKAANTGKEKAFIPDFAISGSDGTKLYAGEKAESKTIALVAGETKNVRFAIPTAAAVRLNELVVTTPLSFAASAGGGQQTVVRHIGHIRLGLPDNSLSLAGLKDYTFDTPIVFDPLNELVDKDVQVSLVELHMHDNQGDGYKTAIAKFKLQNTGKQPASLPAFQAELTSGDGYTYIGDRQNVTAQQLMPGLSHIVSYAFNVPKTEEEHRFALRLLEGGTAAEPYLSPIAAIGVTVQDEAKSNVWNLYPFEVEMKYWSLSAVADAIPVISYSYKLTLDLDIKHTEDVVVDNGFSKLKIEIADGFGKMLGSETIPFVGTGRLISGKQTIRFNNIRTEQHQYPLTIHIYEVIDTPSGEATRLIQTLKQ